MARPKKQKEVETMEAEKPEVAKAGKSKVICVYNIKENDEFYPAGSEYTGENGKYFVSKGAAKEV